MRSFRAFCTAFTVTACLVGLVVGLFTVGYGSRKTAQGEGLSVTYRVENGQLIFTAKDGDTVTLPLTREDDLTAPLSPAPMRISAHLIRGMTVLVERGLAHFTA